MTGSTEAVSSATLAGDDDAAFELQPFPSRGRRRHDLTGALQELYIDEAASLDEWRYDDWLAMLAPGFIYQVPVPLLREDRSLPRHSDRAMVFEATKQIMAMKLGRVDQHYAWSDRPGAAVRHMVGNVRVFDTQRPGDFRVDSNVFASWNRGIEESAFASAGREDVVRSLDDGRFLLLRRRVLLDVEVATYLQLSIIF